MDNRTGQGPAPTPGRIPGRARSNTAHSYQERYEPVQEELTGAVENRPTIRPTRIVSSNHADTFPREVQRDPHPVSNAYSRPVLSRTPTFEGPTQIRHEQSPVASQWIQRTTSDTLPARRNSTFLNTRTTIDPYADSEVSSYGSYGRSSPERMYGDRSCSPATSHGSSVASRRPSSVALNQSGLAKKAPPPPPPSRAKKPPPPPPPVKRTLTAA